MLTHYFRACKDPKDRLYGLLALANSEMPHIKADYGMDPIDLFFKVLETDQALVSRNACKLWESLFRALELDQSPFFKNPFHPQPPPGIGPVIMVHGHATVEISHDLTRTSVDQSVISGYDGTCSVEMFNLAFRWAVYHSKNEPCKVYVPAQAQTAGLLYLLHGFHRLGFILRTGPVMDKPVSAVKWAASGKDLGDIATGAILIPSAELMPTSIEIETMAQRVSLRKPFVYATSRRNFFDLTGIAITNSPDIPCETTQRKSLVLSMTRQKFAQLMATSLTVQMALAFPPKI